MNLPFSDTAFLDLFGEYNRALWPIEVGLWVWTAILTWRW
jgi:hypothetical protein